MSKRGRDYGSNKQNKKSKSIPNDPTPIINVEETLNGKKYDNMVAILGYKLTQDAETLTNSITNMSPNYIGRLDTIKNCDTYIVASRENYYDKINDNDRTSVTFAYHRKIYKQGVVDLAEDKIYYISVEFAIVKLKKADVKLLVIISASCYDRDTRDHQCRYDTEDSFVDLVPSGISFKRWFALEFAKTYGYLYCTQIDENVIDFDFVITFSKPEKYDDFLKHPPQFPFQSGGRRNSTKKKSANIPIGKVLHVLQYAMLQAKEKYKNRIAMIGLPTDGQGSTTKTTKMDPIDITPKTYKIYILDVPILKTNNITYRIDLNYMAEDIAFAEDFMRSGLISVKMMQIKYVRSKRHKYVEKDCIGYYELCNVKKCYYKDISSYISLFNDQYFKIRFRERETGYPGFMNFSLRDITCKVSNTDAFALKYTRVNFMLHNFGTVFATKTEEYTFCTLNLFDNISYSTPSWYQKCIKTVWAKENTYNDRMQNFFKTDMPYPLRWYLCFLLYQYKVGIEYQEKINKDPRSLKVGVLHPRAKIWLAAMINIFISIYPINNLKEYKFLEYLEKLPDPPTPKTVSKYVLPNWLEFKNIDLGEKELIEKIFDLEPIGDVPVDYRLLDHYTTL